ncbi:hypothetical protein H8D40_06065 [Candidatus Bathyarchaeota archaeon]|nr:hypothetical protein [Candidatus Bathyarchaeota archaeon]
MERKVPVLAGLTEESSQEERATAAFETIYKIRNVTVSTVDLTYPPPGSSTWPYWRTGTYTSAQPRASRRTNSYRRSPTLS